MSYSNLVSNQNELLSGIASENMEVEAGNIRALDNFDKSQKKLTDDITDLKGKEAGEIGKTEIMDGIPINEDDIATVMGGKATYNLVKNTANLARNGLDATNTLASTAASKIGSVPSSFKISGASEPVLSPADIGIGKDAEQAQSSVVQGVKQVFGNKAPVAVNKPAAAGAKAGEEGENLASNLGKDASDLGKEGGEVLSQAGRAGKILGAAGAGLSIASGLELGSKDITGLVQGKGWGALGDNTEERVGNILDLAGDVTSVIPGGEIVGGLLDLAGGAFSFFGEKSENKKLQDQIDQKKTQQDNATAPPPQLNVIHPSLSSLGIVSNVSHPVGQMIASSGSF